jgi:hypothetical protein
VKPLPRLGVPEGPCSLEPCFEATVQPLQQLCRCVADCQVWQLREFAPCHCCRCCLAGWLSSCPACRDKPPLYSPLRYGSHLESKVLTNFELEDAAAEG